MVESGYALTHDSGYKVLNFSEPFICIDVSLSAESLPIGGQRPVSAPPSANVFYL